MNQLLKEVQLTEDELLLGNIVLYPTDTVWGIGCDALNPDAIKNIYKLKAREETKAMIVLMANIDMLERYVQEVPDNFEELLQKQERPTTFVFQNAKNFPAELLSADGSIAVRIPQDDFCHRLLMQFRRPVVSTSANRSGEPTPQTFADISDEIKEKVDFVVRIRQDEAAPAKPSRILRVEADGTTKVLRD
ncbi:threonylcarbamoyl-AMP synthase [Pontibacter qinzhouensis]|uniref:L-threonylcarbamoyladenylate synthase n=1 Tax=Pontibacter qinzhouensis TaxID=2603253 RepID=A0A5C8IQ44_9BACT|nr:L-threonylcarbamoyladenylate synthase [Pontibacter qinzhouensis]TXK23337.1 threonylcarbamoyl-AMP synthase [Pontibacter qinzhouensis]